jgi:hypothetical protein
MAAHHHRRPLFRDLRRLPQGETVTRIPVFARPTIISENHLPPEDEVDRFLLFN